jgi:hypothetical protein
MSALFAKSFILIVGLTAVLNSLTARQPFRTVQQDSYKVVDADIYEKTLDILFNTRLTKTSKDNTLTILRFEPSFSPECQIVLKEGPRQTAIIYYKSLDGNMFQRMNQLIRDGVKQDPDTLAAKLHVSVKTTEIPRNLLVKWNHEFLQSIAESANALEQLAAQDRTGSTLVVLDGTKYLIEYIQGTSQLRAELYDVNTSKDGATPKFGTVKWMITVQKYAESHD